MLTIFWIYNLIVFIAFGADKLFAIKKMWRISEQALILMCLLAGATGGILAMVVFCHKTRKMKFRLAVPICFLINVGVALYLHYSGII